MCRVLRPRSPVCHPPFSTWCCPYLMQGVGDLRNGTESHHHLAQESFLVFPWATLTVKFSALLGQVLH